MGLSYQIVYRRGVDNGVADALSRRHHSADLLAISSPTHYWISQLTQWYPTDTEASKILEQLALDPASCPPFSLHQGLIRFKNKLWLGSNRSLQVTVISALHDSPVGGHSRAPATYQKIKQLFY